MEMLEAAFKKYQNKILTAAEMMDALINISKEMVASDQTAKQIGLSDFEYAFYTAVANNDSAKQLMARAGRSVNPTRPRKRHHRLDHNRKCVSKIKSNRQAHIAAVRLPTGYAIAGDGNGFEAGGDDCE